MFQFLKRLRGKDADEAPRASETETAPKDSAPMEKEVSSPTASELYQMSENSGSELVAVELPKRSIGHGIRSLFSDSMSIDELEDVLILADFGVETAEEITAELRREANKQGATTDPE